MGAPGIVFRMLLEIGAKDNIYGKWTNTLAKRSFLKVLRATALSADFGISFSTVGCWAACGRLWVAIERLWVAKRRHMMLIGVIYTTRALAGTAW